MVATTLDSDIPRLEMQIRGIENRVLLNREILKNLYWMLPVDDRGHENYVPVGRGVVSSPSCARWVSYYVCYNVEEHKGVVVKDVDYTGKVAVAHHHMWCHKSSCPKCFIRGWAVRLARYGESRLLEGVKRGLGKIEHLSVSIPPECYGLSEEAMREIAWHALKVRGVTGCCMIFHGYRIDRKRRCLVWGAHYHAVGFIEGGFNRCRTCVHKRGDCAECNGFKGRQVREYAKDRMIVKVLGQRKTVFGTLHYQLHHATIRVGIKRFHVVTWHGNLANNNFHADKLMAEIKCPACGSDMVRSAHVGERVIVKDIGSPDYVKCFADEPCDSSGSPNWIEIREGGGYG